MWHKLAQESETACTGESTSPSLPLLSTYIFGAFRMDKLLLPDNVHLTAMLIDSTNSWGFTNGLAHKHHPNLYVHYPIPCSIPHQKLRVFLVLRCYTPFHTVFMTSENYARFRRVSHAWNDSSKLKLTCRFTRLEHKSVYTPPSGRRSNISLSERLDAASATWQRCLAEYAFKSALRRTCCVILSQTGYPL